MLNFKRYSAVLAYIGIYEKHTKVTTSLILDQEVRGLPFARLLAELEVLRSPGRLEDPTLH